MNPVPCPVCDVEPGQPCTNPLGRPTKEHMARSRRAQRPQEPPDRPQMGPDSQKPPKTAPSRHQVLQDELAKARARHQQLSHVIEYLEGELAS